MRTFEESERRWVQLGMKLVARYRRRRHLSYLLGFRGACSLIKGRWYRAYCSGLGRPLVRQFLVHNQESFVCQDIGEE
jgi:hypothetical protein